MSLTFTGNKIKLQIGFLNKLCLLTALTSWEMSCLLHLLKYCSMIVCTLGNLDMGPKSLIFMDELYFQLILRIFLLRLNFNTFFLCSNHISVICHPYAIRVEANLLEMCKFHRNLCCTIMLMFFPSRLSFIVLQLTAIRDIDILLQMSPNHSASYCCALYGIHFSYANIEYLSLYYIRYCYSVSEGLCSKGINFYYSLPWSYHISFIHGSWVLKNVPLALCYYCFIFFYLSLYWNSDSSHKSYIWHMQASIFHVFRRAGSNYI